MALPMDALSDIFWWEQHVLVSFSPIRQDAVHYTLYSDASLEGWGGTDITTHIGGRWTDAEMPHHINALELQAAYLTLQALGSEFRNVHICLMLDNTTATTYINKMGGTHSATCSCQSNLGLGYSQECLVIGCLCPWFTKPHCRFQILQF